MPNVGDTFNPYKLFHGAFIPNWLLARHDVSQGAKLCYGRLMQRAGSNGECVADTGDLADDLGVNRRQVNNYLKELRGLCLIASRPLGGQRGSAYAFLWHEWAGASSTRPSAKAPSGVQNSAHLVTKRADREPSGVQSATQDSADLDTQYIAHTPYSKGSFLGSRDVEVEAAAPASEHSTPPEPKGCGETQKFLPGEAFELARKICHEGGKDLWQPVLGLQWDHLVRPLAEAVTVYVEAGQVTSATDLRPVVDNALRYMAQSGRRFSAEVFRCSLKAVFEPSLEAKATPTTPAAPAADPNRDPGGAITVEEYFRRKEASDRKMTNCPRTLVPPSQVEAYNAMRARQGLSPYVPPTQPQH